MCRQHDWTQPIHNGPSPFVPPRAPLQSRLVLYFVAPYFAEYEPYINFLNKKHEKKRVALGKDAKVVDHSMFAVGTVLTDKEGEPIQQVVNDNALERSDRLGK